MCSAEAGNKLCKISKNIDPNIKQIHCSPIFSIVTGENPKLIREIMAITETKNINKFNHIKKIYKITEV